MNENQEPQPGDLHKFLKADSYDKFMWSWVTCLRKNLPTVTVDAALQNFIAYFHLDPDKIESMRVKYYRMCNEFIDLQKTKP